MIETFPDRDWNLENERGGIPWDRVPMALLMDIRRELRALNALLRCSNFTGIPGTLRAIKKNTTKKRRPLVKR